MALEIVLYEGHSLAHVVRGMELVLALDAARPAGRASAVSVHMVGPQSGARHLMAQRCRDRLRVLQRPLPDDTCAHRLIIAPKAAAHAAGTYTLDSALARDARGALLPSAQLRLQLYSPHAVSAQALGGVSAWLVPLAVGDVMRPPARTAAGGICVVGCGSAQMDRASLRRLVAQGGANLVLFDPYQQHTAHHPTGVQRIVGPVGPSRRAMLYASCRYVVSAHSDVHFDDHFVCEAVAMGLVPLGKFAPATMAPDAVWDSEAVASAHGSAVAHSRNSPDETSAPKRAKPCAEAIYQALAPPPPGRPYGLGGPRGMLQWQTPDDVAAVHALDGRALVVYCGADARLDAASTAWLLRCDYRAVCLAGPCAAALEESFIQALRAARPHSAPAALAAGEAALAAWCFAQREAQASLAFDVVHLGGCPIDVAAMRTLMACIQSARTEGAAQATEKPRARATVIVSHSGSSPPQWAQALAARDALTWVLHTEAPDAERKEAHRALQQGEGAGWAALRRLMAAGVVETIVDADGATDSLAHECLQARHAKPICAVAARRRAGLSLHDELDLSQWTALHEGACRGALGWPSAPHLALIVVPELTLECGAELAPLFDALKASVARAVQVHFCVAIRSGVQAAHRALEHAIDARQLGEHVTLSLQSCDPFERDTQASRATLARMQFGAASLFIDGPWAKAEQMPLRHRAMAAALPVIAWPGPGAKNEQPQQTGVSFAVSPSAPEQMASALQAYVETLCLDVELCARMGARAQTSARAILDVHAIAACVAEAISASPPQDRSVQAARVARWGALSARPSAGFERPMRPSPNGAPP